EKVAIVPGTAFGDSGEGYLRISYAYSIENLRTALGRLSKFIGKLRESK
ncbi:MAG: pyridoxal phosphate-dependent aminotransferase, partial [Eubacteriales bacterium]|nr:pyridoxal phosphate-dependent aminotransferase [Eubacteriales bacterium]